MASDGGQATPSLKETLQATPYRFEFLQAIRIIQRIDTDAVSLAEGTDPTREALQIKARVAMSAPPSDIYRYEMQASLWGKPVLTVNFFGLVGIQGPMPVPYTELVMERNKAKDYALDDFFNIFNHRLISLYYRLQVKVSVGFADVPPEETEIGAAVQALVGLDEPALRGRLAVPDNAFLTVAGLVWQRPKSLWALQNVVRGYFSLPIQIYGFEGGWKEVPFSQRTAMGASKGRYQALGRETYIGGRYWDEVAGIRAEIGPLSLRVYQDFLPQGSNYKCLIDVIKFFLLPENDLHLKLTLKKEEVPPLQLGKGMPLGWLSSLRGNESAHTPEVTVMRRVR